MANQTITQLPDAGPITGTELVPVVQNGGTFKTTAAALAGSPVQTQTFLTLNQEPTLNDSRFLSSGTGVGLVDGGAQSFYRISLNGVSGTLESMGNGFGVKINGTMTPRSITYSGSGIDVTNGDGQSGNPTISLTGTVASLANNGGTGFLALPGNGSVAGRTLTGTASQIDITNPNGIADNPTFSISDNPVLPGVEGVVVPAGDTSERPPVPANGTFRYNNQTGTFEGYASGNWGAVVTGAGLSSVGLVMPSDFLVTNSPITSSGDLTASYVSQTANKVFASPSGSSGTPTFRALDNNDLPNSGVVPATYGSASQVPVFAVNAKGVVTSVTNTAIAISNTAVSGLGTMSTQNANSVAITGGTVDGTTIGGATPAAGTFTNVAMTTGTVITVPANSNDIVNKSYVDTLFASGIHFHQPVRVESPINLNATYNNGTAGVGATLTNAGTQAALVIDGVTVSVNDRVLIYTQTTQTQNGIYVVTNVGSGSTNWVLTRSSDANTYVINSAAGLSEGSTVFVQQGATGAGETYTCNTSGVITFGTTNITFVQIMAAQIYSAGTGLTLSGTQFSITNTAVTAGSYGSASSVGTFSVNAQGQLTSAASAAIAIAASQITSGTVSTVYGGTGLSSYTAGDLSYYASGTALTKLAIGAANRVLTSTGSAPQWTNSLTGLTSVSSTAFTENGFLVVSQADIGTAPNEVPLNQYLGNLAYQDASNIAGNLRTGGSITANGGISGGTF